MTQTITLYRPTGQKELTLVAETDYKRWPPRLPEQPIFYPVTNEQYAIEIAQRWNTQDRGSGWVGYVTRFQIKKAYLDKYEIQQVGASYHTEYWIPATELETFNDHIVGKIEVIHKFVRS